MYSSTSARVKLFSLPPLVPTFLPPGRVFSTPFLTPRAQKTGEIQIQNERRPVQHEGKWRLAAKQAAATCLTKTTSSPVHTAGSARTAVEKAISSFLEQFKLSAHVDAVVKLTTSGFTP